MKKIILTYFLIFFTCKLHASPSSLKVTWFGSTCLTISDGKTSMLFDPFFTRPSFWKIISFQGLKSDSTAVKKWLSKTDVQNISAVITSHSHYDHVLDLIEAYKFTRAKIYGSESTKNIALGGGVKPSMIEILKLGQKIKLGDFEIQVYKGEHPPHFLGLTLASGKITKPLKLISSAYAYKKDKDYSFYIKHPAGNILFHPSGNSALSAKEIKKIKAKTIILGLANRKSTHTLIEKIIKPIGAVTILPVHYDNIFRSIDKPIKNFFGVNMPEFYKSVKEALSGVTIETLKFGETFHSI